MLSVTFFIVVVSVIMQSVVMMSVIMLNVVMLSLVAPFCWTNHSGELGCLNQRKKKKYQSSLN
jgi:hypothetical protein